MLFAAYLCSLNTIGGLLEVTGGFPMIYYLRGIITGARWLLVHIINPIRIDRIYGVDSEQWQVVGESN